jgi:hypothetical protein
VLAHESDSVFYDSPSVDQSGSLPYFHRAAKVSRNGAFTTESTIERLVSRRTTIGSRSRPLDTWRPRRSGCRIWRTSGSPSELYVVRVDGTGLRSVATSADDVIPGWSPDGAPRSRSSRPATSL